MTEYGIQPNRSRWRGPAATLAVVVAVIVGLIAGAVWHEPLAHALHLHNHPAEAKAGATKQLWTCGMHPQVIRDQPGNCPICGMKLEPLAQVQTGASQMAGTARDVESVRIDPVIVQNMGVRVARATRGPVRQDIRAVGYLQEAQPNVRDVNLRVSGWIEKLHADTVGMALSRGAPLFDLYSPEVQVAAEELIAARKGLESLPAGADAVARRTSQTLFDATRLKLEQWGLDGEQVQRLSRLDRAPRAVTFTSPIDGYMMQKMVVQGAAVKAGDMALRIVDLSTVWLDAQVYAQDLPFIKLGEDVTSSVEGVPGKTFEGKVVFIHPQVDPQTRTATVRMALANPELALRPGLYATAEIRAETATDALLIPREAVLDTGTRQVVFVAEGEGRFSARRITTANASTDGMVQVVAGLSEGDAVVTSGQFLLDAESRMREAIQKHLHERLLAGGGGPAAEPATEPAVATTAPAAASVPVVVAAAPPSDEADKVFAAYLAIQNVLGAPQKSDKPIDPAELVRLTEALASSAKGERQTAAQAIGSAASALRGQSLSEQRKLYKPLSESVIALARLAPPSESVARDLVVAYCPMAPGEGARWLQSGEAIHNPYFATSMKECGTVEGRVAAAKAGPQ